MRAREAIVPGALLPLALFLLARFYPVGVDWEHAFDRVGLVDPYRVESFVVLPWTVLFLPHALLPLRWGNAVNFLLNVLSILFAIKRAGGSRAATLLAFTSPVFFDLARTNNIEWLPLLGLLVSPWIGSILLLCKPQCLAGALLIWAKRDWRVLLFPLAVGLASFLVWGWWPGRMGPLPFGKPHNFSAFPAGLPYGAYLLHKAWREDDAYLAAVATPLFVPYIAPYSLVGVLAVLASRRPKAGAWLYFGMWAYVVIESRRTF